MISDHRHAHEIHTETPIKHVVVIFDENRSFDHYFGTYPNAANPAGDPVLQAAYADGQQPGQRQSAGRQPEPPIRPTAPGATDPFRLDRAQANTAFQNHAYGPSSRPLTTARMDLFPNFTGSGTTGGAGAFGTNGQVMGYFDGNTVTAMWNYAQHFAMSDNAYTDTFGPSTPGAIEVISGQTNGGAEHRRHVDATVPDGQGGLTLIGDTDPAATRARRDQHDADGRQEHRRPAQRRTASPGAASWAASTCTLKNANGTTGCDRAAPSRACSAAPRGLHPASRLVPVLRLDRQPDACAAELGRRDRPYYEADGKTLDPANHHYDLDDFFAAVKAGNFPSCPSSRCRPIRMVMRATPIRSTSRPSSSKLINFLQQQPDWKNTAVIITYDDSDGWYDHRYVRRTASYDPTADQVNGAGLCGHGPHKPPAGATGLQRQP